MSDEGGARSDGRGARGEERGGSSTVLPSFSHFWKVDSPAWKPWSFALAAFAGVKRLARNDPTIGRMTCSPPLPQRDCVEPPTSMTTSSPLSVADTTARLGTSAYVGDRAENLTSSS